MPSSASSKQSTGESLQVCDGQSLKRLARAGLAWLEKNYETVNALNVFPVPDGDTGTNILLTMRSAYKEIANSEETDMGRVAQLIYNGALMGARGNSGVILSQLWRGFAAAVDGHAVLDTALLVRAFHEASRMAYRAVQAPVEGTILTVAREAAEAAEIAGNERTDDSLYVLEEVVKRAHDAVKRTPTMLAVLREAGVVDSGGMGLTYVLEGMLKHLKGETLEDSVVESAQKSLQSALEPQDELGYGYDVQFLIKGQNLDVDQIRRDIEAMGDSTLVVGDSNMIKVHVHVHNPGVPVGYGADKGVLLDVVVENMQEQYQEFVQEGGPHYEADQPHPTPEIEPGTIAAVTVAAGDGLTRIFYSMGAGHVIEGGQTMNPSTEDFVAAIRALPTDKIVLLPNNKNIMMSARTASELGEGKDVRVIPTTTIPQGIAALLALDPTGEMDEVCEAMKSAGAGVETGEVTTATRTVTLNGVKVKEGQIIGLHNDVLRIAGNDVNAVVVDLLNEMGASDLELISVYYGATVKPRDAEVLIEHLSQVYPNHEIELKHGGQAHYFYILSAE